MLQTDRNCPQCKTPLLTDDPDGLCPRCLLEGAIAHAPSEPLFFDDGGAEPAPTLEELEAALPGYDRFERLGAGGMGTVFGAHHIKLDRPVAVKILRTSLSRRAAFTERFLREAQTLAKLDHPNIVRVYDFGQSNGLFYLVMEFVDGMNLRSVLISDELRSADILAIMPQVCDALQYAHSQGVVHRDIKPENILIDVEGRVRIADFGLAKLARTAPHRLTGTRQVMGTPHYMAPEQIERPQEVDHRADIFSLGVVLYEMLTGELPLGSFAKPSTMGHPDMALDQVVLRALEKEPSKRYQQASEIRDDIAAASRVDAEPVAAGAAEPPPLPPRGHRRREYHGTQAPRLRPGYRVVAVILLALLLGLGALAVLFLSMAPSMEMSETPAPIMAEDATVDELARILNTAIDHDDVGGVRAAIGRGAEVNPRDGKPPLLRAVEQGHFTSAMILLQNGANADAEFLGRKPLHVAALRGELETVGALLARGATDSRNRDGKRASDLAGQAGHGEIAEMIRSW